MKKLVHLGISILLIFTAKTGFAQDERPHLSVSNVLKLDFILPGISYEQKITNYNTLNFSVYMDGTLTPKYASDLHQSNLVLTPSFSAEFRTYYNLHKRDVKGKNTALNSANYFAPLYIGRYAPNHYFSDRTLVNQVGAVWGMQRNYPKRFSLDLSGGLVYTFNAGDHFYYDPIELLLQVKIGFWTGHKTNVKAKLK